MRQISGADRTILPRLLRLRDAPIYLGMDKNRFNKEVRPSLTEIPIGEQGIAFDRLEMDAWVDQYIECNGRPGLVIGGRLWDAKERRGLPKGPVFGTSTKGSVGGEFAKALEQLTLEKRSST